MKNKLLIIPLVVIVTIAGAFYWSARYARVDKTSGLHKAISPLFVKAGLTDDRLVKKSVEEHKLGRTRYVTAFVEYDAPRSFVWRNFDRDLRLAVNKSEFRIADVERSFEGNRDCHTIIINYRNLDVLTVKINHGMLKIPARAAVPEAKSVKRPKVAIVVDDFGYSKNNINDFLSLKQPVTISILPEQPYSREIALMAKARGFETMLHLPMEAESKESSEEPCTIHTGMSEKEVLLRVSKEIASVPGIDGVNNHQGSKATSDAATMTTVLKSLKARNLFFLDSLTSVKSVGCAVAKSVGLRHAKRDMFLDNSNNTAAIEKQLANLKALAFKRGQVIAICHDRKNTIAVLKRVLPEMAAEGIEFVRVSELVKS